ncbi:MAG: aspartate carbamoyltransferase catalytic subunit [Planctomycetes bacterium]|nr:aspartate carbamoyltransferase catalytic subunit [Planctomycetota bacterium]
MPRTPATAAASKPAASSSPAWSSRHLLGLQELSADEIRLILRQAEAYRELATSNAKKSALLKGRLVVTMFVEPSTRTKVSFNLAARRLGADTLDFAAGSSSLSKGETLVDTALNIEAMAIDILVVRHPASGSPESLTRQVKSAVVNAGDGAHEHPTQGLLDVDTILAHKGKVEGLRVGIVGDILHSRVARSNIWALTKLGAEVWVCGPSTLIPAELQEFGVKISHDFDDLLPKLDVVNILRIQLERIKGPPMFPSIREYARLFGLNGARLKTAKKDILVMHPGPLNRGVEITPDVADGPRSVILDQVAHGLAVRMAVLHRAAGFAPFATGDSPAEARSAKAGGPQ